MNIFVFASELDFIPPNLSCLFPCLYLQWLCGVTMIRNNTPEFQKSTYMWTEQKIHPFLLLERQSAFVGNRVAI